MIRQRVMFETDDGRLFPSMEEALRHDRYFTQVQEALSLLLPKPDELDSHAVARHNPDNLRLCWNTLLDVGKQLYGAHEDFTLCEDMRSSGWLAFDLMQQAKTELPALYDAWRRMMNVCRGTFTEHSRFEFNPEVPRGIWRNIKW